MQKNRGLKVKLKGRGVVFIRGTLLGLVLFAVFLSIGALIITKSDMDADKYFLILQIIIPLSAFFSSFFSGLKSKMKGIAAGLLQALILILPITIILLIINSFNLKPESFIFIPLSLIVGTLAGIISANIKR